MFDVAPWEMASDETPYESFETVEHNGERWELALTKPSSRVYQWVHFRRGDGPILHATPGVPSPLVDGQRGVAPGAMKQRFIECLSNGKWTRSLYWNERFELRREGESTCFYTVLEHDGTGFWSDKATPRPNQASFKWGAEEREFLIRAPADELVARLWAEPDFDYARRFISFSADERWDEMWKWRHGDRHEMQQVLTWALLAQEDLWQTLKRLCLFVEPMRENQNLGGMLFSDQQPSHRADDPTPLPHGLHEALAAVLCWFGPEVRTSHAEEHLCLSHLLDPPVWFLRIQPKDPTAHERMEATMRWWEWLAQTAGS